MLIRLTFVRKYCACAHLDKNRVTVRIVGVRQLEIIASIGFLCVIALCGDDVLWLVRLVGKHELQDTSSRAGLSTGVKTPTKLHLIGLTIRPSSR